jgi:hypothetical protein
MDFILDYICCWLPVVVIIFILIIMRIVDRIPKKTVVLCNSCGEKVFDEHIISNMKNWLDDCPDSWFATDAKKALSNVKTVSELVQFGEKALKIKNSNGFYKTKAGYKVADAAYNEAYLSLSHEPCRDNLRQRRDELAKELARRG